jgi:hypothetical protein
MKSLLSVFLLLLINGLCYSQSNFEFEFGRGLKLETLISQNNKKVEPLKWINVNTNKNTWSVRGDSLIDSGQPTGVVRTEKQYENFILHVEWKHMDPGGNSGVFVWSNGSTVKDGNPYPDGIEVQMLDPEWINMHKKYGQPQTKAYISGEMWGVNGITTIPDNPEAREVKALNTE